MKLRAGDLVITRSHSDLGVVLYMNPPEPGFMQRCGTLGPKDLAIVISLHRHDGAAVYVIGPNCAGWTFGAGLRKIDT